METRNLETMFELKACEYSDLEKGKIIELCNIISEKLGRPDTNIPLQNLVTEVFQYSIRQHFLESSRKVF